jgi:hypothetical protein
MSIISITSFACTAAYLCDNGGGRRRYVRQMCGLLARFDAVWWSFSND